MRTRRSPRNQDILFRSLFKPEPVAHQPHIDPIERIKKHLQSPFLSKTSRSMFQRELSKLEARQRVREIIMNEEEGQR